MILDREIQKNLLIDLRRGYPGKMPPNEYLPEWAKSDEDQAPFVQNLYYLEEHGLVELLKSKEIGRRVPRVGAARITAQGMDFLENDGGLTAILGTVTVRLHADTIRDLIEARIMESEAPPEEKKRLVDTLKTMPEEGLKHLTTRLIDYGLAQSPSAWQALSSMFG